MIKETLKEYNYEIPENLIAQEPLKKRDQAKLMIVDREKNMIIHDNFKNLDRYLPRKSLVVLNNSRVIPARLLGKKERSGGQVEIFLLKKLQDGYSYEVLLRPFKKIRLGDKFIFNSGNVRAELIDRENRIVRFNKKNITGFLEDCGHMPLPPYIKRPDKEIDKTYYQTVFAKSSGSVAAPTAGLHFTEKQIAAIQKQGHRIEHVTLHINYATFKPVEVEDITKHKMHVETYSMTKKTYEAVNRAKKQGQKIVAVGTTSCRVLETVAKTKKLKGETNLFIYPGYKFQFVDILLTNFHQPLSTLLMLVSAFGGKQLIKKAYKEAIKQKYRFFSYGDAMLII